MKNKVGIIVGRFQVPELHEGHKYLIETAIIECNYVIVFIGSSTEWFTERNPLPFYHRKNMLLREYPELKVLPLEDIKGNDILWIKTLDVKIDELLRSNEEAILYGSRDSCIAIYEDNGCHNTRFVEQKESFNGTEDREKIKNVFYNSPDFRRGIIYTVLNQNKQ